MRKKPSILTGLLLGTAVALGGVSCDDGESSSGSVSPRFDRVYHGKSRGEWNQIHIYDDNPRDLSMKIYRSGRVEDVDVIYTNKRFATFRPPSALLSYDGLAEFVVTDEKDGDSCEFKLGVRDGMLVELSKQ